MSKFLTKKLGGRVVGLTVVSLTPDPIRQLVNVGAANAGCLIVGEYRDAARSHCGTYEHFLEVRSPRSPRSPEGYSS